jgi:hypothetical protein
MRRRVPAALAAAMARSRSANCGRAAHGARCPWRWRRLQRVAQRQIWTSGARRQGARGDRGGYSASRRLASCMRRTAPGACGAAGGHGALAQRHLGRPAYGARFPRRWWGLQRSAQRHFGRPAHGARFPRRSRRLQRVAQRHCGRPAHGARCPRRWRRLQRLAQRHFGRPAHGARCPRRSRRLQRLAPAGFMHAAHGARCLRRCRRPWRVAQRHLGRAAHGARCAGGGRGASRGHCARCPLAGFHAAPRTCSFHAYGSRRWYVATRMGRARAT